MTGDLAICSAVTTLIVAGASTRFVSLREAATTTTSSRVTAGGSGFFSVSASCGHESRGAKARKTSAIALVLIGRALGASW